MSLDATADFVVDFPTLGYLWADWIAWHCPIPDGFHRGEPYVMSDWQLWNTLNHGRVKPTVQFVPQNPIKGQAFVYRRTQVIAPQKTGKGPWSASMACNSALGPELFAGWAVGGEVYDCRDYGCGCGFVYEYEPGEPMGMPWPTPLIQMLATSEDQVDNMWRPLVSMVKNGPLSERMRAGEEFIRIGDDGRIDKVTSNAQSRLGNPTTAAYQDETGIYTIPNGMWKVARTMRRGVAGMGGRVIETTNSYDPAEKSIAQATFESTSTDIFRFYREPPAKLSFKNKRERRKILEFVYEGSWWVDLDAIEAEAVELMETDPAEAERFFGNRRVRGLGTWLPDGAWEKAYGAPTLAA